MCLLLPCWPASRRVFINIQNGNPKKQAQKALFLFLVPAADWSASAKRRETYFFDKTLHFLPYSRK